MVTIDTAQVASLKRDGHTFEILIDVDLGASFKEGSGDISDVLAVEKIFSDAQKSMEISPEEMQAVFGTDDVLEVAAIIVKEGQFSMSTAHKAELRDRKLRQVVEFIHRNAVDPRTHAPHPSERIERALEEAKVTIDDHTDVKTIVQEAIRKVQPILPLKFETKLFRIELPNTYASKTYGIIKGFGTVKQESWKQDGGLVVQLEIPGGVEEELYDKINEICHGEATIEEVKQ